MSPSEMPLCREVVSEAPQASVSWLSAYADVLLLEVTKAWSVAYAVEMVEVLVGVLNEHPARTLDIVVHVDEAVHIDLRNFALFDLIDALKTPVPNVGQVICCGRYYIIQAVLNAIAGIYEVPLIRHFSYQETVAEALHALMQARRAASPHVE